MKLCRIFHYLFSPTLLLQHRRGAIVDTNLRSMALWYLTSAVLCRLLISGANYAECQSMKGMLWLITEDLDEAWPPRFPRHRPESDVQSYSSHLPMIIPWNRLMQSHNQAHFWYQKSLWTINYWGPSSLTSIPHHPNHLDPPPKFHSGARCSIANPPRSAVIEGGKVPRSRELSFAADWECLCTSGPHPVPLTLLTTTGH